MTVPALELVAAVAANGVIGRDGQLPWHLPDDLKHFKSLTLGHAVIMGRRTFESIGRPLPGRHSIVVGKAFGGPLPGGITVARSPDEALRLAIESPPPAFVIGGAALYEALLPWVRALHLTELDQAIEGDTVFPLFDRSNWRLRAEVRHEIDTCHAISFRFCTYERTRDETI